MKARKTIQEGISVIGAVYPGKITFTRNNEDTQSGGEVAHDVTFEIIIRGDGYDFDDAKLYDFLEEALGKLNTWFTENWRVGDSFVTSRPLDGDPWVTLAVGKKTIRAAVLRVEGTIITNYTLEA
jgi:hypothetical protein